MNDKNVYSTPQSQLVDQAQSEDKPLASRWSRLGASIIDSIIVMIILVPLMFFTGGFEGITEGRQPEWTYSFLMGIVSLFIFFAINYTSLVANGQTLGKKVLEIKIVDLDGNLPSFKSHLLTRYGVYFLPGQIPFIGPLFSFVNILFIFGGDKRCLHDLAAKTKVVQC